MFVKIVQEASAIACVMKTNDLKEQHEMYVII